jgi:NAD(P)-dependent dehydrogenase (short-subunit alcohol dehydrogenase family)
LAVLITGASSGVGAATAERFARDGHDVVLLARSETGLGVVADRVRGHGVRALVCPVDLTDRAAVEAALVTTQEAFGRLDVAVLAAALTIFGPTSAVRPDDFDRVLDVTFLGAVNTVRAALPLLERSGGAIVSVSSLNARVPLPAWSSYCAAKHALRGFLYTLAIELRAAGSEVRIAQLLPGPINTPVWSQTPSAAGRLPRRPPAAIDPAAVANAVFEAAQHQDGERVFGIEAIALDRLWSLARPVGDAVLGTMFRYFLTGRRRADDNAALWSGAGTGAVHDGIWERPGWWPRADGRD